MSRHRWTDVFMYLLFLVYKIVSSDRIFIFEFIYIYIYIYL